MIIRRYEYQDGEVVVKYRVNRPALILFMIILGVIATQLDYPKHYSEDCELFSEHYAYSMIYCDQKWLLSEPICNYYEGVSDPEQCVQLSLSTAGCQAEDIKQWHVCKTIWGRIDVLL